MPDQTKEENITFGGIEAKPITIEAIHEAISLLKINTPEPSLGTVLASWNCSAEQLKRLFGDEYREFPTLASMFMGYPILKRKYVPDGEVWFVSTEGKVLAKFKVHNCQLPKDCWRNKKHWEGISYTTHDPVYVEDDECGWWECSHCGAKLNK